MHFMAVEDKAFFNRKHDVVTDGLITLHASNKVLCAVWSYHFSGMMVPTE